MANEYPRHVRREARRLWLTGRFTDLEVAAKLGLPRADTVRDWRNQEAWATLAKDIAEVLRDEVKREMRLEQGAVKEKYAQLSQVLESRAIRALSDPGFQTRDLKWIANTLLVTLKMREKLVGPEDREDKLRGTLAGLLSREYDEMVEEERGKTLGRCRGDAQGADGSPEEDGDTVTTTDTPAAT